MMNERLQQIGLGQINNVPRFVPCVGSRTESNAITISCVIVHKKNNTYNNKNDVDVV